MSMKINIAIDGPAGAGKSTVAKKVAASLSYTYIDTGAMYRAITYTALKNEIDIHAEHQLEELLKTLSITLTPKEHGVDVYVNEEMVTDFIRDNRVTNQVSVVASHRAVREAMLHQQREMAKYGGTVMDGRDIGTHVLPDAEVKIFLTASVEQRAMRRYEEIKKKGIPVELEKLMEEIEQRDRMDSNREIAPLKKASDAKEIDSTALSIEEVVENILDIVKERL